MASPAERIAHNVFENFEQVGEVDSEGMLALTCSELGRLAIAALTTDEAQRELEESLEASLGDFLYGVTAETAAAVVVKWLRGEA